MVLSEHLGNLVQQRVGIHEVSQLRLDVQMKAVASDYSGESAFSSRDGYNTDAMVGRY
jgi:hypothetical protein